MAGPLTGHTNTYHTYGFEEALAGIAGAGFSAVELSSVMGWTEHVSLDESAAAVRRKVEDHGLEAVALSAHSDLTSNDGLAYGLRAVEWANDYGLRLVTSAIGGHASQTESERAFLDRIPKLAKVAEDAGVIVALEIHGDLMATGRQTAGLFEQIASDAIRVKYDVANCEFYGATKAVDDMHHVLPLIANMDLKDKAGPQDQWNFPAPGSATVDFPRILEILDEGGYTGPMAVEIEFTGEPWPPLGEVNAAMRSSYDYLSGLGLR